MKIIGLADKEQLEIIKTLFKNKTLITLCSNIFDHEFIQNLKDNNIKVETLFIKEELETLKINYPTFLNLTEEIKKRLATFGNDFIYLSTSFDPLSSDWIASELEHKECLMFKTTEIILNKAFNQSHNFNFQLPLIKKVDFLYYLYHFDKEDKFIIPNVIDFIDNKLEGKGKLVKVSNIANVKCFIPDEIIYKTIFDYLWSVMIKLRYNCQWDRIQTSESIKNHLIEEAYEVLDTVEKNDPEKFKSELGDLLLQIIFHSQIQSDFKKFNFYDVVVKLVEKLINRHPHVFTENQTEDLEKILVDWEKMKNKENKSIDLPKSMPSLLKMYLLYRKIKRLKKEKEFEKIILQEIPNYEISNILLQLHEFHLQNSENLENLLNQFLDKLTTKINQSEIVKTRD